MDRREFGTFLFTAERFDRAQAALAVLVGLNGLRVSEAWATSVEDLGLQRGHRILHIVGKGNKPATIPLLLARRGRSISPSVNGVRDRSSCAVTDSDWTDTRLSGGCEPSASERAWD